VSFAAIILCVGSQQVFIVVSVYFLMDSVRELLDTPSYICSDVKGTESCKIRLTPCFTQERT
jgi:hypothetical protein